MFMGERCVISKANISFAAFYLAFEQWLAPSQRHQLTGAGLIWLMQAQDRFNLHVEGRKVFVLNCTIPGEQRDMVGS